MDAKDAQKSEANGGKSASLSPQPRAKSPRSKSHSGGANNGGGKKKPASSSSPPPPPPSTLPTSVALRALPLGLTLPLKAPPPPTLPEKARLVQHHKVGAEERTQEKCFGNRSYSEVVVETYKPSTAVVPATKSPDPQDTPSCPQTAVPDSLDFFYGNPFVEKTTGILHFYKNKKKSPASTSTSQVSRQDCSMLCMLAVPAFFTCREVIQFVAPMAERISEMKVIRDEAPNQYMLLLKFKAPADANSFYHQYNDTEFNSIEVERCTLMFVERIETQLEEEGASLPVDSLAELPTCSVCLERLDDGVLTILCNHSFHAECLQKWADTTCPVCRCAQTPELVPDQACCDCRRTTDLWMCLICGNIGCGRYAEAHAFRHYEATSHIFALQVGGKLVWDYVGDNYVHRLVQSSTDGKMVEYMGPEDVDKESDKLSAIQLEYSCLLTSQLENQRFYFEERLRDSEQRHLAYERDTKIKISSLESGLSTTQAECSHLKTELDRVSQSKQQLEKKHQQINVRLVKLQCELEEERQMSSLMRSDKEQLARQKEDLEQLKGAEIVELKDQLHDLMMHFEAANKIQSEAEKEGLTQADLDESSVEVQGSSAPKNTPAGRKKNAKRSGKK